MTKEITEVKDKVYQKDCSTERAEGTDQVRLSQAHASVEFAGMQFVRYLPFPIPTNLVIMFGPPNISIPQIFNTMPSKIEDPHRKDTFQRVFSI